MTSEVLLYVLLAGIVALILALFQYFYKSTRSRLNRGLSVLRFLSYFFILLLIVNPKFDKTTVFNEKPNLLVAVDNSESISHLGQNNNALEYLESLKNNEALNAKFDISYYSFGEDLKSLDSLNFSEPQTDISTVFKSIDQVYKNTVAPVIMLTDGNQTYGADYEYTSNRFDQAIYPVILGDTTTYSDLKIQQLNVNRYAYLKNRFPVELFISYTGNNPVNTQLIIRSGNAQVYSESLSLSKENNSQIINLTLPANRVGVNTYTASISPIANEKNTVNNTKPFAVEVIDQKTNVAIISSMTHPDLGALKNAIESNEQRSVEIISPATFLRTKENYQLAILYQPNNLFKSLIDNLEASGDNYFLIAGTQTQWSFLNSIQSRYEMEITRQEEDYQPELNTNYGAFIIDDLDFRSFPPIRSEFGQLSIYKPYEIILYKSINGTTIDEPLLLTIEENNRREAILLGEDIWKWRAQSYLNNESFQDFDNFIGKLVQYLATNQQRRRLNVSYESFYNGNSDIVISAQFFNRNYEFDNKASLEINLQKKDDESSSTVLPFVIKQNNYQVDLSGLESGEYSFTVRANGSEATQTGSMTILDYNVENQFLNANVTKLEKLAEQTNGKSQFIQDDPSILLNDLLSDSRYATIQKSTKNVVPLIDFKILLALIALSLAAEWFIRKYNGLI